jgi:hypothetical protein
MGESYLVAERYAIGDQDRLYLVPGAGLEPARTLPGPRDFKSVYTLAGQHQPQSKTIHFGILHTTCVLLPTLASYWFKHSNRHSERRCGLSL